MSALRLMGLRVLVTGAGTGIGAAIAERLAVEGAAVAVHGFRHADAAAGLVRMLSEQGHSAVAVSGDLRLEADCRHLLKDTVTGLGGLDALVLNAGISLGAPLAGADLSDVQDTLQTNLFAPMQLTALALPVLLRQKRGRVVAISSTVARGGLSGQCAYAASKAGLAGFIKTLANELSPRMDFTANLVLPGVIPTAMSEASLAVFGEPLRRHIPQQRFGTPQDVAAAVAYLLSPDAAYVNGQELAVDGGFSLGYIPRRETP